MKAATIDSDVGASVLDASSARISYSGTGPLLSSAPSDWYETLTATSTTEAIAAVFASYTSYAYNQLDASTGNPWSGMLYNSTTDADGNTTETFTDSQGRTIFTVNADNSFTQTLYSVGDTAVPDYTVDTAAGAVLPTIPTGGSETVNIAQRKLGDPAEATIDIYDASGNLLDVYEPPVLDADPSSPTYNQMISPHWTYAYDASGDEISQTDPKGNVTTFAYDQNGNEVSRTLPDGQSENYTYDQYGNVATHTDFDGNTATYTYNTSGDQAGLLQSVTYAPPTGSTLSSQTVSYTYDALNRISTTTDASGTTTDSYDAQSNLTEEQTPEGTINYLYDPVTGEHTETTTADTDTLYGYNAQGELTIVTVDTLNGTTLSTPLVTGYTYDPAGNTLTETLPDGEVTAYAYNSQNQLTQQTETLGATTLFSETLILNDDGTRASADEMQLQPDGSTVTTTTDWTYDADQRLTDEVVTSSTASESYSDVFAYDLNSNRTNETYTTGGTTTTTTSVYNGDDELTSQTATTGGVATVMINTYDANGSLTNSMVSASTGTTTTTYTYDVRNKLATVATNGTTTANYIYDGAGNRVQETANGVTTFYLTDDANPTGYAQPLEEWTSTTGSLSSAMLSRTYLIGPRVFGQSDASGDVSYLLTDAHDSTQQVTDADGNVTSAFSYTAFGTPVSFNPGTAATEYLFGGDALYDPASGLYLNGDGTRDRLGFEFIQPDPQGNGSDSGPISLHRYLYAGGDAINLDDPSGHELGLIDLALTGALLGGSFGAIGSYAATGKVSVESVLEGAALGAVGLPLSVAIPLVGGGLAALGLYQGWELTWHVWTNPQSTNGELTASIILLGTSIFGAFAAGDNIAQNGWYNPSAFSNPPISQGPGLTLSSPFQQIFAGVPDNAMVANSPEPLANLENGVKPTASGKSYWFRWGDIRNLTITQYQAAVGSLARGGQPGALTFAFKLINPDNAGQFQPGGKVAGYYQEYTTTSTIVPDAGAVAAQKP